MKRPLAMLLTLLFVLSVGEASAGDFLKRQRKQPRVEKAWKAQRKAVRGGLRDAGAAWPPKGLFLRALKHEGELELWAQPKRGKQRVLVKRFPICAASGVLGPKAQQGDFQVPEGFYRIDRFNPWSSYHLSLGVDYPNAVDKARQRDRGSSPGGDIFVHGECVTIGCLPLENAPVEWLYLAAIQARDAGQRRIPVHIFPCHFGTDQCTSALAKHSGDDTLTAFWRVLEGGYRAFEATRQPPRVTAARSGYTIKQRCEPGLAAP